MLSTAARSLLPTPTGRPPAGGPREPGSSWLTLLSQTGLIGFGAFALWLGSWLLRQIRQRHGYTIAMAIMLLITGISEGWLTYTGGLVFLCFWLNAAAPAENR